MYAFLLVIHVFVCFVLIAVILLQAGRGGGFSEMLGGSQAQSILGTHSNQFMTRATEVCAVVFIITSLSLAVMSTQRGKSLIEKEMMMRSLKKSLPVMPVTAAPVLPPPTAPMPAPAVPVVPAVAENNSGLSSQTTTPPAPLPEESKSENSNPQK